MTEPLPQRVQQQAARWVILQQQPNFSATEQQHLAQWLAEHPQHRQADQYSAQAIQQVHLADGSQVLLDAQSAISINYSPQRRQIKLLKGAATFYVEPNNAPFQVQVQQTEIQALGTVFMVRQTAQHTQVAALEHSVAVNLPKLGQQLQLDQGQSLQVAANGQQISSIQPLVSQHADWQQGYLVFNQ